MNDNNPSSNGFSSIAIDAARYRQSLIILQRHGITLVEHNGAFQSPIYSRRNEILTFPEALNKHLYKKFGEYEDEIRKLKDEIRELERQIPKQKEIELKDGSVMHVIEDE